MNKLKMFKCYKKNIIFLFRLHEIVLINIFIPFHFALAQVEEINLVKNGSFEYFDKSNYPLNWDLIDKYGYKKMFERANFSKDGQFAIKMSRNCEGFHYMRQFVKVKSNTIYQVSVAMSGTINDYTYGGIKLFGMDNKFIGMNHITFTSIENYEQNLMVKFDSEENEYIELRIGFSNGMNAEVYFDSVVFIELSPFKEYMPQPCIKYFYDSLGLNLSKEGFDYSVEEVCKFINYLNISSLKSFRSLNGQEDEVKLKLLDANRSNILTKIYDCEKDNYIKESINVEANNLWIAYCQRTSLLSSKLLRYLNIATRQIHCHQNGVGFHQFFEYWNPFLKRWIIIDPYYGVKYSLNNRFIGIEEMMNYLKKGKVSNRMFIRVDVNPFESLEESIINIWKHKVLFQNEQDIRLSLP